MISIWIKFAAFTMVLFVGLSLTAGELETAWQDYSQTNARISTDKHTVELYSLEQLQLMTEINQLKRSSTWYNAWYNKLLLSRHSERQLLLVDSLEVINQRLGVLFEKKDHEMITLKSVYERILTESENEASLKGDIRVTALEVGRWIANQPSTSLELPDYSELVRTEYNNPELRVLVLRDVQHLLSRKLVSLDSLIGIMNRNQQLKKRLASFHADLGLQLMADQDAQPRDETGSPILNNAWGANASPTDIQSEAAYSDEISSDLRVENLSESRIFSDSRELGQSNLSQEDSNLKIEFLKLKQNEYRGLLSEILAALEVSSD